MFLLELHNQGRRVVKICGGCGLLEKGWVVLEGDKQSSRWDKVGEGGDAGVCDDSVGRVR